MTPTEQIMWGALAAAGLAGSALCSGFETGAYTVDRLRLDADAARADRASRRLAREIARPDRLLATILVSNNIANYAGSFGLAALLAGAGFSDATAIVINALVLTPMLLIFGEILPKEMFRAGTDRMTIALAPIFWAARWLFTITAIVPALTLFGKILAKLTGTSAENQLIGARENVISLLQEGVRAGVLSERQSSLIDRAIELRSATVTDLMRPWNAIPKMEENWTSTKAQWLATKQPKNRYIIIDKDHKPTGAISAAAVWTLADNRVIDAAENIITLKPNCTAQDALEQLLAANTRVAVVTRAQAPIGVVTLRSLIEPLTGELGALEV